MASSAGRHRQPGRHGPAAPERPLVLVSAAPAVQRLVQASLRDAGFRVDAVSRPQLTPSLAVDVEPDVLVLDAASPAEADSELRRLADLRMVPVMITSRGDGFLPPAPVLDAGAADVMALPLDPLELAARIRALVRRRGQALGAGRVSVGGVTVDLDRRVVTVAGRTRRLGRTDWRLLVRLLAAHGSVVPHDELLAAAFGPEAVGDRGALRAAMGRLRWKLRATGGSDPIQVSRGSGYALRT